MASGEENRDSSDEEEGGEIQLEMVEMSLGTLDLREFEICPSRHKRRRRRKKEEAKTQNEGMCGIVYQNRGLQNPPKCLFIICNNSHTSSAIFMKSHIHPETGLSTAEANSQEEGLPEAVPAEDAPQETQSKNRRKRKAQSKKQLEGEYGLKPF